MLEDHVISIDIAKRLKTLGVNQSSLFHWEQLTNGEYHLQHDEFIGPFADEWYPAFTVSELGELLPEWSSSNRDYDGMWEAYPSALFADVAPIHGERTEADARGKLLIALLEKYPQYPDTDTVSQLSSQ